MSVPRPPSPRPVSVRSQVKGSCSRRVHGMFAELAVNAMAVVQPGLIEWSEQ